MKRRTREKKNRKRKILWFNPPLSANVKTNIGKRFMSLVQKHFPPHHQYRSLFNKNNVKVSYSCVESMGNVIQSHNGKILNQQKPKEEKPCNCRIKGSCPLDGSCRKTCIVYKIRLGYFNNQMTGDEGKVNFTPR